MCRGRDGKNLSEIIKFRWLKYFHFMQRELGRKGSPELKVSNIEIKKITGWRNNRKIDWYEDAFLLCYANHYIVERDKQNVLWVALLMSFTRLMLMECSLFYIVKHNNFFQNLQTIWTKWHANRNRATYCHNLCLIYGMIYSIELHVPVSLKFHWRSWNEVMLIC